MSRGGGHCGSGRLDLGGLVWFSTEKVIGPNFTLFDHLFVLNAEFVDSFVFTSCDEGSLFFKNFKTPSFTIEMGNIDEFLVSSVCVNDLNSSVIVTYENSAI
jgi:hypothetical protein